MSTYVIGEIGQNHNGSVDLAKLLVEIAARPAFDNTFKRELKGFDAVKLTMRDLDYELTRSAMNAEYESKHSFGKTYGEHRQALELSYEEHHEVFKHAKRNNLDFVETFCAPSNLNVLKLFVPDRLKVASRDLTNLPLLTALAETKIPLIISTGMAGKMELDNALSTITRYHDKVSILHCLSEYPTDPKNLNLNTINYLLKEYKEYTIGYSDHSIGISVPVAAVAMGAKIIEKHITIDRNLKGTDQAGSLAIDGMSRMMRDIRNMDLGLGFEDIFVSSSVESARVKLERSVAAKNDLPKGHVITEEDLILLSPGSGVKWVDRAQLIGKRLTKSQLAGELINLTDLE